MSDIYLYDAEETDFDNIGLCGALLPNEAKFSEIANGNATLTLCHPRDEYGKFALIERGMILKAAVPVRTTPEITNGEFVTTVYEYTVSSTATKEQRKIWSTRDKTKQKRKCLKVAAKNDPIVVVKTFSNTNYFTKVKYTYKSKKKNKTVTGFIDPAALQGPAVSKVIPATPAGMDSVADSWNVKDQLFRIENVEKTESEVNVTAHHISYDFMYNLTSYNFDGSKTLQEALDGVFGSCFEDHGFDAQTNITSTLTGFHYADKDPITAMMDPDIGLVSRFDGELVRDNYMFTILDHAGTNRGYRIEYGKNMTGISWQIDETSVAGAIRPYGETKKGNKLYLNHSYIANDDYTSLAQVSGDDKGLVYSPRYYTYTNGTLTNTLPYTRIYAFQGDDCKATVGPNDDPEASDITEAMVRTRLKDQSLKALKDGADVPDVSISVDIKQLGNSVQYADFAELEKVFLFDTVLVYHRRMGILADAVVSAIEWDVIQDELVGITLGTIRDLSQSIASWQIVQINGGKIMPSTIPGAAILPGTISGEHIIAGDITAREIQAESITADKIAAGTITADKFVGQYADFETLVSDNITADTVAAKLISADEGYFETLGAEVGEFVEINANQISAGTFNANVIYTGAITAGQLDAQAASIDDLVARHISTAVVDADQINADNISTTSLGAAIATISEATIASADIAVANIDFAHMTQAEVQDLSAAMLTADKASLRAAGIDVANVNSLYAAYAAVSDARIETADIDIAKIDFADITEAQVDDLSAYFANIDQGTLTNLFASGIYSDATKTNTLVTNTGYITNALIHNLTSTNIQTGSILAESLLLRGSEDGLIYKLNVGAQGLTPQQLSDDEYALHGKSIMTQTITGTEVFDENGDPIPGQIKLASIDAVDIKAHTITTDRLDSNIGYSLDLSSNVAITQLAGNLAEDHTLLVNDTNQIATLVTTTGGLSSRVQETADSLSVEIGRIDKINGTLDPYTTYMKFDSSNFLTIGASDSPFSVQITNTALNFRNGTNPVAWVDNENFFITNGEVRNSLIIGKFKFVPQTNGNMSLMYNG